eukprot:3201328-Rhodomonas_salina.2
MAYADPCACAIATHVQYWHSILVLVAGCCCMHAMPHPHTVLPAALRTTSGPGLVGSAIRLRACYAMCSTDVAYGAAISLLAC